jgi:hypothetical protein
MQQSPEIQNKIANWRAKQEAGTMSTQDWIEAFQHLRAARMGAQAASAASKAKRAPVDLGALKDSLRAFAKKDAT